MNSSPDLAAHAAPTTPDAHNEPGPTLDERIQVFEGRHLPSSLAALAVFAVTLFFLLAHWTR